jgi:hypothetical protein
MQVVQSASQVVWQVVEVSRAVAVVEACGGLEPHCASALAAATSARPAKTGVALRRMFISRA